MRDDQERFTAVIGFIERPTIDGRVWRPASGTIELRDTLIPLLRLPDDEHEGNLLLGHIDGVSTDGLGVVRATGQADRNAADDLNCGRQVLLADMRCADSVLHQDGLTIFPDLVLAAARVGPPSAFAWETTQ